MAFTGAFAFGGASLIGSGCTILTNDALPDDAGVFEGGDGGTNSCNLCGADKCTATWAVCLTNSDCIAIRTCASAAGADPKTCACGASLPDAGLVAESAYRAFATCNDSRLCSATATFGCATDCAGTLCKGDSKKETPPPCGDSNTEAGAPDAGDDDSGAVADAGADDAATTDAGNEGGPTSPTTPTADTCTSCTDGKCGDAKKGCAIGSECASFLACVFACADGTCAENCGRLHATGKVAAVELATCTQASCENECGLVFLSR